MKILIVDDSRSSCDLLTAFLTSYGYQNLLVANSGEEALNQLTATKDIDLILMDFHMPGGMNGTEVTRMIKFDQNLRDIPVIIITAIEDKENLERAFEAGAIDYINKPVDKLELRARVNSVLRLKFETDQRKAHELELIDLTKKLRSSNCALETMNKTLETKVQERTAELQRAYENLQEIDRLKTAFISNVSHELFTPLTSVLGYASLIQSKLQIDVIPQLGDDNKTMLNGLIKVTQNVDVIISEAKWLAAKIGDILDFAKMESGEITWKKQLVYLPDLMRLTIDNFTKSLASKQLTAQISLSSEIPSILVDKTRMQQVFNNIITNAINFTEKGEIHCDFLTKHNLLQITISDTGSGIDASEHTQIFDKFNQIATQHSGKPKGTGLGLPICKHIIEQGHNGKIWVESQIGQGSSFFISLPIINATQA